MIVPGRGTMCCLRHNGHLKMWFPRNNIKKEMMMKTTMTMTVVMVAVAVRVTTTGSPLMKAYMMIIMMVMS